MSTAQSAYKSVLTPIDDYTRELSDVINDEYNAELKSAVRRLHIEENRDDRGYKYNEEDYQTFAFKSKAEQMAFMQKLRGKEKAIAIPVGVEGIYAVDVRKSDTLEQSVAETQSAPVAIGDVSLVMRQLSDNDAMRGEDYDRSRLRGKTGDYGLLNPMTRGLDSLGTAVNKSYRGYQKVTHLRDGETTASLIGGNVVVVNGRVVTDTSVISDVIKQDIKREKNAEKKIEKLEGKAERQAAAIEKKELLRNRRGRVKVSRREKTLIRREEVTNKKIEQARNFIANKEYRGGYKAYGEARDNAYYSIRGIEAASNDLNTKLVRIEEIGKAEKAGEITEDLVKVRESLTKEVESVKTDLNIIPSGEKGKFTSEDIFKARAELIDRAGKNGIDIFGFRGSINMKKVEKLDGAALKKLGLNSEGSRNFAVSILDDKNFGRFAKGGTGVGGIVSKGMTFATTTAGLDSETNGDMYEAVGVMNTATTGVRYTRETVTAVKRFTRFEQTKIDARRVARAGEKKGGEVKTVKKKPVQEAQKSADLKEKAKLAQKKQEQKKAAAEKWKKSRIGRFQSKTAKAAQGTRSVISKFVIVKLLALVKAFLVFFMAASLILTAFLGLAAIVVTVVMALFELNPAKLIDNWLAPSTYEQTVAYCLYENLLEQEQGFVEGLADTEGLYASTLDNAIRYGIEYRLPSVYINDKGGVAYLEYDNGTLYVYPFSPGGTKGQLNTTDKLTAGRIPVTAFDGLIDVAIGSNINYYSVSRLLDDSLDAENSNIKYLVAEESGHTCNIKDIIGMVDAMYNLDITKNGNDDEIKDILGKAPAQLKWEHFCDGVGGVFKFIGAFLTTWDVDKAKEAYDDATKGSVNYDAVVDYAVTLFEESHQNIYDIDVQFCNHIDESYEGSLYEGLLNDICSDPVTGSFYLGTDGTVTYPYLISDKGYVVNLSDMSPVSVDIKNAVNDDDFCIDLHTKALYSIAAPITNGVNRTHADEAWSMAERVDCWVDHGEEVETRDSSNIYERFITITDKNDANKESVKEQVAKDIQSALENSLALSGLNITGTKNDWFKTVASTTGNDAAGFDKMLQSYFTGYFHNAVESGITWGQGSFYKRYGSYSYTNAISKVTADFTKYFNYEYNTLTTPPTVTIKDYAGLGKASNFEVEVTYWSVLAEAFHPDGSGGTAYQYVRLPKAAFPSTATMTADERYNAYIKICKKVLSADVFAYYFADCLKAEEYALYYDADGNYTGSYRFEKDKIDVKFYKVDIEFEFDYTKTTKTYVRECKGNHEFKYCGGHIHTMSTGNVFSATNEMVALAGSTELLPVAESYDLKEMGYDEILGLIDRSEVDYDGGVLTASKTGGRASVLKDAQGSFLAGAGYGLNLNVGKDGEWLSDDMGHFIDSNFSLKCFRSIFDIDYNLTKPDNLFPLRNYKEYEGWTADNVSLAVSKYGADWYESYGFDVPSEIGCITLSETDKKAILEDLAITSETRKKVVQTALDWVGRFHYSDNHQTDENYHSLIADYVQCKTCDINGNHVDYSVNCTAGNSRQFMEFIDYMAGGIAAPVSSKGYGCYTMRHTYSTLVADDYGNLLPGDFVKGINGDDVRYAVYIGKLSENMALQGGKILLAGEPIFVELGARASTITDSKGTYVQYENWGCATIVSKNPEGEVKIGEETYSGLIPWDRYGMTDLPYWMTSGDWTLRKCNPVY